MITCHCSIASEFWGESIWCEMSCMDLVGFASYRRSDAYWWEEVESFKDGVLQRDPACFLAGGITVGSSGGSSSGKCSFSFCLAEAFAFFYLCVFSLMLGWTAARQLIWIIFVIVLWQKAAAHCKQNTFAWYPHHPHPVHCVVALGFLPGEIPL